MYDKKIKWKNIFAEKQPKNVIKMIKEYAYFFKSHHIEARITFSAPTNSSWKVSVLPTGTIR